MPRPSLHPPPEIALVIEVIGTDHRVWTGMATEWGRVLHELNLAPTAIAITIYEWQLIQPLNPRPNDPWAKYPRWKKLGVRPWTLDMLEDVVDGAEA